jgi:hypothetical protein
MYIRTCWPGNLILSVGFVRSNILVSESGDGGSAASAAFRQILNKPQAQLLGQAS